MAHPQDPKKALALRVLELLEALQLVADCLRELRAGKDRYMRVLSGELRSLLTEKSRGAKPLLLDIADKLGNELNVRAMLGVGSLARGYEEGSTHMIVVPPIPLGEGGHAALMPLRDVLDIQYIFVNGTFYTPRELITWIANNMGGSHYGLTVPAGLAALGARVSATDGFARVVWQIGDLALEAGARFIKSLVDLELHMIVCIPQQDVADNTTHYLVNAIHENGIMGASIGVSGPSMRPFFQVRALDGTEERVQSEIPIDWSEPRYLRATTLINADLSTTLELMADEQVVGLTTVSKPLFVRNGFDREYDRWVNTSLEGRTQEFTFGLGAFLAYGERLTPDTWAKFAAGRHQRRTDPSAKFRAFLAGRQGVWRRGDKTLQVSGDSELTTAAELLANKWKMN